MANEQPMKYSRLQVETDLNALTEVLHWFEQLILPLLPYNLWWESQVALTEGFTNIVRHAHHNLPQTTPIEIEVKVFADCLEIRIWDLGQPFDLEAQLQRLYQENLSPLEKEGGRGLIFMKHLMDELCHSRLPDQRNCLTMRKRIHR